MSYLRRPDALKIFYLRSRGIPENEAFKLIMKGFLKSALRVVNDEAIDSHLFDKFLSEVRL